MEIDLQVESGSLRLDRWLGEQLPDFSRSYLQKLIEQGNIKLNDRVCSDKKIKVNLGDRLSVVIPPSEPLSVEAQDIQLDILYEDDALIIIDKPAGLVVHPAPGHDSGTLVNALLFHCSDLAGIGGVQRPGIVHRLDKDTTGVLVVAKTDFAHQHLQTQLKAKTARREYLAIVHGVPKAETGTIDLPIGRHPNDRKRMAVVPLEKGGREAVTYWKILERIGNYTLTEFRLETGRTHQIRVHTSHLGHPILGDPIYSSNHPIGINLPGQMLHAHRLTLEHPVTGKTIEAVAAVPPIFTKVLTALRRKV